VASQNGQTKLQQQQRSRGKLQTIKSTRCITALSH